MTQFNLSYRIDARDGTRSILASALSGVTRFARLASKPITIPIKVGRSGLALLRDVNVGLRPLVSTLDNIIERGSRLEVVSKSFQSLNRVSAAQTRRLARELVAASSGTLTLARSMEIANRALAGGLSFEQTGKAIEFVGKKAITTGKNSEQAIEKVITGLSRGSTLFLDDFGILVDGIEGVKRSFDRIKGEGAFDSLGPAAQKAEVIRQAIAEMGVQMGKIGVSGRETVFLFQGLKNEITNSVDKLISAIGQSKSLNGILRDVRDTVAGITEFIERGGSIKDVLFGREGGRSDGLFGILKAGFLDIGEGFGRAILGGILKAVVGARDLFDRIDLFAKIIEPFKVPVDAIKSLPSLVGEIDISRSTGGKQTAPTQAALDAVGPQLARTAAVHGVTRVVASGAGLYARVLGKIMADNASTDITNAVTARSSGFFAAAQPAGAPAIQRGALTVSKFVAKRAIPAVTIADFIFTTFGFLKELKGLNDAISDARQEAENETFARNRLEETRRNKASREREARRDRPLLPDKEADFFPSTPKRGLAPQSNAGAATIGGSLPVVLANVLTRASLTQTGKPDFFDHLDRFADRLLGGGGGRLAPELNRFLKDFPAPAARVAPPKPAEPLFRPVGDVEIDRSNARLSKRGRRDLENEQSLISRDMNRISAQSRRDARAFAGQEVRRLRREGFDPGEEDRRLIERRKFDELFSERTVGQRERIEQIFRRLDGDTTRRGQESQSALNKEQVKFLDDTSRAVGDMKEMVRDLLVLVNSAVDALVGSARRLSVAGARRN